MNYSKVTKTLNKHFDSYIESGVYNISDIEYFEVQYPVHVVDGIQRSDSKITEDYVALVKGIEEFVSKHPNACLASAFETEKYIILSEKPTKIVEYKGSGFAHGSTNIIDNCPKRILILEEEKEIFFPKTANNNRDYVEEYDEAENDD